MPVDGRFAELVARVGGFHITQRKMKHAQLEIERAITDGEVDQRRCDGYLAAVREYFDGFAREARAHLRDVDRRLVDANQVQFNLTAERGVAVKRIEATDAVLHLLAEFESGASVG